MAQKIQNKISVVSMTFKMSLKIAFKNTEYNTNQRKIGQSLKDIGIGRVFHASEIK